MQYTLSQYGVRIGHAQNLTAATGCTVILTERGAVGGCDVRGGAPGTRETDVLEPTNTVDEVHAVLLSGGSAYGLDAAAGVMRFLEERKSGFATAFAVVPIVASAVLYDLSLGDASVRPGAQMGYEACLDALQDRRELLEGCVGAGTGATVGKLAGFARATKSGIGYCERHVGGLVVAAITAVNAVGEVVDRGGHVAAGIRGAKPGEFLESASYLHRHASSILTNTTIGCVITNARLTKSQAKKVAQMSQDGLARSIRPIHTPLDGDTIFALSVGDVLADVLEVGALAAQACEVAVLSAVCEATTLAGLPSARDWK